MVFFLLKDKEEMLEMLSGLLPKNRRLTSKVGAEMNQQISTTFVARSLKSLLSVLSAMSLSP